MNLTHHERFLFLAGLASQEVEEAARRELTDEQSCLSLAIRDLLVPGDSQADLLNLSRVDVQPLPSHPIRHLWRQKAQGRWISRLLIAAFCIAIGSYSAWAVISTPILSDPLTSGWFNSKLWLPPPDKIAGSGVRAEEGFLRLVNRGYLRPRQELPSQYELEFDWKWSQLGLNPQYAEHLTLAIRTTGDANVNRPHEAADGIIIKFNAWGGYINIAEPDGNELARTASASTPFPAEKWHRIRVLDDGERISIYVTGPLITPGIEGKALLEFRPMSKPPGPRFAIYNRELVGFPHESMIRNLVVREYKKSAETKSP